MMFRFNLSCVAVILAGPAFAERQLPRSEVIEIMTENAICYVNEGGNCYSAEFFDFGGQTGLGVTYTYLEENRMIIAREQVAWVGDNVCVADNADTVTAFWTIDVPDREFQFDLSNATPLTGPDAEEMRGFYARSRTEKYCYGYFSTNADRIENLTTVVLGNDVSNGTPVRLIPLSTGAAQLEF